MTQLTMKQLPNQLRKNFDRPEQRFVWQHRKGPGHNPGNKSDENDELLYTYDAGAQKDMEKAIDSLISKFKKPIAMDNQRVFYPNMVGIPPLEKPATDQEVEQQEVQLEKEIEQAIEEKDTISFRKLMDKIYYNPQFNQVQKAKTMKAIAKAEDLLNNPNITVKSVIGKDGSIKTADDARRIIARIKAKYENE